MPKINVKKKKVNIHIVGSLIKEPAKQLEIMPSADPQEYIGTFDRITVAGDKDLIPENLPKGLEIFGVEGTANVGDLGEYFYEDMAYSYQVNPLFSIIKKIPPGYKAPENCERMFYYLQRPVEGINEVDFSETTSMSQIFSSSKAAQDQPIDLSEAKNVTNFNSAFSSSTFGNLIVNFENATTINGMFENAKCSGKVTILGKPKATSLSGIFRSFNIEEAPYFDTSGIKNVRQMFYGSNLIKRIPLYDFSSVNNFDYTFYFSTKNNLEYIGGFKNVGKGYDPEKGANYSKYSIDLDELQYSINTYKTLTVENSILNVIENLYDIASAGIPTQKIYLGSSILKYLTPEQIAVATNKGWTVV